MKENDHNSHKDFIVKEIKVKRSSRNHKKKMKTMITTKKLDEIEVKEEKTTKFSKFSLGKIEYAKIHSQATRPLKQLQDLSEEEKKKILALVVAYLRKLMEN